MYGYDQFLIAGTIATLFWLFATLYLQKKWLIYTLIAGKKHAYTVHLVIMSFVALQQLFLTVFDYKSRWLFTSSLWPLGDLVFAASLTLLVTALYESGPGILVGSAVFDHKKPHKGPLWRKFKQPLALGFGGMYLGMGLLTGHIVYLIAGGILGVGLFLMSFATRALQT